MILQHFLQLNKHKNSEPALVIYVTACVKNLRTVHVLHFIKLTGSQEPPCMTCSPPLTDKSAIISQIYLPLLLRGQRGGTVEAGWSITEENKPLSSKCQSPACWNLSAVWDKVSFQTKNCATLRVKLSSPVSLRGEKKKTKTLCFDLHRLPASSAGHFQRRLRPGSSFFHLSWLSIWKQTWKKQPKSIQLIQPVSLGGTPRFHPAALKE